MALILARMGRLDVLVDDAGIGDTLLPTVEQGADLFMRQLDIHLKGTFVASREAATAMLEGGRRDGQPCLDRRPRRTARCYGYGAAKPGTIALTRSMAAEWGSGEVRVNAIASGYIRTALVETLKREWKIDTAAIVRRAPRGRLARPEKVVEVACFLAAPAASYVTGVTLPGITFGVAGRGALGGKRHLLLNRRVIDAVKFC